MPTWLLTATLGLKLAQMHHILQLSIQQGQQLYHFRKGYMMPNKCIRDGILVGKKEARFEAIFIPFYQVVGIFWTMWKFWSFQWWIVNLTRTRTITQVIQMV